MHSPGAVRESGGRVVSDVDVLIQGYSNYLQALQKSPCTVKGYTSDVRAWADWWKRPVELFGTEEWDDWTFYQTESGLAGKSIRRHQTSVKRFFKYLRRRKLVTHDPSQDAEAVQIVKKLPVWLEEGQVKALRQRACGHRTRAILAVLYECGLRNSEARHLKLSDISSEWVRVIAGKGAKDRLVPMTPKVWELLQRWIPERKSDSDWLFNTINHTPVAEKQVQGMVRRLAKSSGCLLKVTPHTLRHSIATHLYNRGVDLIDICQFLGHEDVKTTAKYVHLAKERMRQNILKAHPGRISVVDTLKEMM